MLDSAGGFTTDFDGFCLWDTISGLEATPKAAMSKAPAVKTGPDQTECKLMKTGLCVVLVHFVA